MNFREAFRRLGIMAGIGIAMFCALGLALGSPLKVVLVFFIIAEGSSVLVCQGILYLFDGLRK